jgi:RNA polymerase sigma-70 factor, ECF subfamily
VSVREAPLALSDLEPFRRELTGYCYRMLGSSFEAEDAVQEARLRAWRNAEDFEGRSSVRSWLYRIATNVCIDMHRSVQRRARPMEMSPASPPDDSLIGPMLPEAAWVTPVPDSRVAPESADPADIAQYRESIRLAFVTALQHLPARQRAALILCEVLRWQVAEVADLLRTSVPAVNSALQRARATLRAVPTVGSPAALDSADVELLERYVDAFERYDIERWWRCYIRTPCNRCRPTGCGSRGRPTLATSWSSPVPATAVVRALSPPRPTVVQHLGNTGPIRRAGTRRGRSR